MGSLKLVIYGNGHMAQTLYQFAREAFDVAGFTVDRAVISGNSLAGLPLVAFDEVETHFPPRSPCMITAVGYIEMNRLRARKHLEARNKGYTFPNFVHRSVDLPRDVTMGENNVILEHVSIHPRSSLGDGNFLCSNISIGHGCRVGDYCWMNSGVSIAGETKIANRCVLGMNAAIGDGLTIEEGCYVSPGALLSRSTGINEVHIAPSAERFPMTSDHFLGFLARRVRSPRQ